MLLNAAKYQGNNPYHFWEPAGGGTCLMELQCLQN